ncbi:MAG: methyltransferase domain-containing protein [Candidatus Hydrogenedentes bacterium]|nr:methyltransferase domain-containing protein [Candidatus Hydrogenedentota bacterium]
MDSDTGTRDDWYADAFGALYPVVYARRTAEAARPEAAFAAERAGLGPGDTVLDLCCGTGRHAVHLAPRVRSVAGLDYSPALLELARRRCCGPLRLVRGDMRRLPFGPVFDVVFNFFTSFGYFLDEGENALAAREMARVLKPGGRLFLDHIGADCAVAGLVPHSERTEGDFRIVEERSLAGGPESRRVNKRVTVLRGGETVGLFMETVRLYTPEDLAALFTGAGLAVEALFGDYDGRAPGPDAPRMMLLCRKGGA